MSNLAKFKFVVLGIKRKNYLFWILHDVEIHLDM